MHANLSHNTLYGLYSKLYISFLRRSTVVLNSLRASFIFIWLFLMEVLFIIALSLFNFVSES